MYAIIVSYITDVAHNSLISSILVSELISKHSSHLDYVIILGFELRV